MKSIEKQPKKHTKILSLNSQALKCETEDKDYLIDKKTMTISQNMFSGTTSNTYLFMSNKKENQSTRNTLIKKWEEANLPLPIFILSLI